MRLTPARLASSCPVKIRPQWRYGRWAARRCGRQQLADVSASAGASACCEIGDYQRVVTTCRASLLIQVFDVRSLEVGPARVDMIVAIDAVDAARLVRHGDRTARSLRTHSVQISEMSVKVSSQGIAKPVPSLWPQKPPSPGPGQLKTLDIGDVRWVYCGRVRVQPEYDRFAARVLASRPPGEPRAACPSRPAP